MSNPFSLVPSHRAPKSKATILRGPIILGTAFRDAPHPADVRLDQMLTAQELRHVADLLDGWVP